MGKGWEDSASYGVLIEGRGVANGSESGYDSLSIGNVGGAVGLQALGPYFVGIYVWN